MSVDFGVRIPPCDRIDRVADCIVRAEAAGLDTAWIPDSQLLWRDAYSTMAIAAHKTTRIGLAPCVANVTTRHPSVLAQMANSLNELAPGRFSLGLGTGDSAVRMIGGRPARRSEMLDAMTVMRHLWSGEDFNFGERACHLTGAFDQVPIIMAASGPKNLAFAAEHADGVLLLSGVGEGPLQRSLERVKVGAAAAGRTLEMTPVTVGAFFHVTDDIERDAPRLKPVTLTISQNGGQAFLAEAGIDLPNPGYIDGVYPDMTHAEDWDLATDRADEYVSDEDAVKFARAFALFGTAEEIVRRIRNAVKLGATGFYLRHVGNYSFPDTLIRDFGEKVLPLLKDEGLSQFRNRPQT